MGRKTRLSRTLRFIVWHQTRYDSLVRIASWHQNKLKIDRHENPVTVVSIPCSSRAITTVPTRTQTFQSHRTDDGNFSPNVFTLSNVSGTRNRPTYPCELPICRVQPRHGVYGSSVAGLARLGHAPCCNIPHA